MVAVVCASCAEPEAPPGRRPLAVWSEFLTDAQVRAALPFAAEERADVYLAIPAARIGDASLASLIADAQAAGVGVRAWLLLDEADGYWPNEHNLPAARAAATAFADWRDAAALPIDWVIFDLEMSLQRTEAVAMAVEEGGSLAAVEVIRAGRDPAAFEVHRGELAALVGELQARGLKVMCVTYPTVLDDPDDGDEDIQDELDVPVAGVPWDQVSFMVYQSAIYDLSGSWHGPDVVYSYGQSAVAQYGDRAAVALGIVGSASVTPVAMPYPDAPALLADHAAARAAGVGTVSVYSLDGVLQQGDAGAWLDAAVAPVEPPYLDADYLRDLVRGLLDGE